MDPAEIRQMRTAQQAWARLAVAARLRVVHALRQALAEDPAAMAGSIPNRVCGALERNDAESLVAEVMPLLSACRMLEREAERLLRRKRVGTGGRPLWLMGTQSEVERIPHGIVLILAPGNYPLLLAGIQVLQALVAGNAVAWKPAPGTEAVARRLTAMLVQAGLPLHLLRVLEGDAKAASAAIEAGVDWVVLTGSAATGTAVLHQTAETLTPTTMELSGWDAVFVLPGVDEDRLLQALLFGMRLNGSLTCMAPRRLFLVGLQPEQAARLEGRLQERLAELPVVCVSEATRARLEAMVRDAVAQGARAAVDGCMGNADGVGATLLLQAGPTMLAMQGEAFGPILSVMRVDAEEAAVAAHGACPYRLSAAIFGPEAAARRLARQLDVSHVVINDLILPTADPRIGFGGAGRSGFGVTRGREGLLAMTRPRVVQVQRSGSRRSYEPLTASHGRLLAAAMRVLYGVGWRTRVAGLRAMIPAMRELTPAKPEEKNGSAAKFQPTAASGVQHHDGE